MAGVPAAPPPAQPCRGPAPCHGSFLPASPSSCTQLRSGLLRSPAGEAAPPRAAPPSAALVGSALVPSLLPSGTGAASPHTGEVRCLRPNATRLCGTTTPQDGADPQPRLHNAPGCEAAPPAPQGGSKPRTAQRWGRHGGAAWGAAQPRLHRAPARPRSPCRATREPASSPAATGAHLSVNEENRVPLPAGWEGRRREQQQRAQEPP